MYVVMIGWANEGQGFEALFTKRDDAVAYIEERLKKLKSYSTYYSLYEVQPDKPNATKEIGFREEGVWKCHSCGADLVAGVGSIEQCRFFELHREQQHHAEFIKRTGKILF